MLYDQTPCLLMHAIDRVEHTHDRIVVTRNGRPAAVMISPDDLATLVYTSGTTGPPKGAMLTVANVEYALKILAFEGAFTDPPPGPDDLTLSYLPRAHVAERIFSTLFNAWPICRCPLA